MISRKEELRNNPQFNKVEVRAASLLQAVGQDIDTPDMRDTPYRIAKFYHEFLQQGEPFDFTLFPAEDTQMVVVREIPFYSLCAHHGLPFFGTATVGYLPHKWQAGLSKIPRVVDMCSRAFTNQERITSEVAQYLDSRLQPLGVAVTLRAAHTCMLMRGIKAQGSETVTAKYTGAFLEQSATRAEFLSYR